MVRTRPQPARTSSTNSRNGGKPPSALEDFARFAGQLRTEDGRPVELYPEQLDMVRPYFEGATESVILVAKKAGKSTLVAALALFHLLTTPFANVIIVAASRDQAEIILNQAQMMLRQSRALRSRMRVLRREITSLIDGGRIRVLASDKDTADGQLPTLAIVDELHRHRSGDLYTVLRLGLGARSGRMVTISTAGATMASPLGELRRRAQEMPGFTRDHAARKSWVRSDSGAFAFVEWSLDPEDDPDDLDLVKLVNPAPWRTKEVLADERLSTPGWSWLRLVCNVWTEGEEPWVEPSTWDDLADPGLVLDDGSLVTLGVMVSERQESAAFALVQPDEERVRVLVEFMESRGRPLRFDEVESRCRALGARYRVEHLAYAAKSFERSADALESDGFHPIYVPQAPERMVGVSAVLYAAVTEGRLVHDGDPELRAQVLAGRVKETETGWRFVNDPNIPRPITGLLALAAGVYVATSQPKLEVGFAWV